MLGFLRRQHSGSITNEKTRVLHSCRTTQIGYDFDSVVSAGESRKVLEHGCFIPESETKRGAHHALAEGLAPLEVGAHRQAVGEPVNPCNC